MARMMLGEDESPSKVGAKAMAKAKALSDARGLGSMPASPQPEVVDPTEEVVVVEGKRKAPDVPWYSAGQLEAARAKSASLPTQEMATAKPDPYKPKPLGRDDVMGPPAQDGGIEWTDPDGKMKYKLLPSGDIDIVVGVNGDKGPVLKKGSPAYQKYAGAILATFKGPAPLPEGKGDMPMAQAGAAGGEMLKGASREAPSYDFGGPTRR